jgi:predicted transcriptional regulator of viral defense system
MEKIMSLYPKTKTVATLFLETVLEKFSGEMSKPSSERPTVRCISKSKIRKLLVEIRGEINMPGFKFVSATDLIQHMEQSRILTPIPIVDSDNKPATDKFWAVGLRVDIESISPIELLEAMEPKGVISYFTALQIHELTTQIPTHHHIAQLKKRLPRERSPKEIDPIDLKKRTKSYDSLGTKQFYFCGIPYYCTSRDRHLIPGIQSRHLNDKTIFNITTLEQTLLDTLHRPLNCGGPSVVFEAWERALDSANERRMVEYITQINDMRLNRRVGFILENLGYQPQREMKEILDHSLKTINKEDPESLIPLFTGLKYSHSNPKWLLEVP